MNVQHLLSPHGRLGQRGFLILGGGLLATGIVAGMVPGIGTVVSILFVWPWMCIAVKRLHDMGRSGKIAALLMAVNLGLSLASVAASTAAVALGIGALPLLAMLSGVATLSILVSLAFLGWLAISPSDAGENRFGPPAPTFSLA